MEQDVHIEKDVKEFLEEKLVEKEEILEKTASINWDGKNFLMRIPKEIAKICNLNQKNVLKKKILFKIDIGKMIKTFDIIKRTEPKRKTNQNETKKKITKKR